MDTSKSTEDKLSEYISELSSQISKENRQDYIEFLENKNSNSQSVSSNISMVEWIEEQTEIDAENIVKIISYMDIKEPELLMTIPQDFSTQHKLKTSISEGVKEVVNKTEKIYIVSPFLDKFGIEFIIENAKKDAKICIITRYISYGPDYNKDACRLLLNSDIESTIYEYQKEDVFDIHAKIILSDNKAYLGTANITQNGLRNNLESGFLIKDRKRLLKIRSQIDSIMNSEYSEDVTDNISI